MERILRQCLLVVRNRVFRSLLRFVNVSPDPQCERIVRCEEDRNIRVDIAFVGAPVEHLGLTTQRIGFDVLRLHLQDLVEVPNGRIVPLVLGEKFAPLREGVQVVRLDIENFVEIGNAFAKGVLRCIGAGPQHEKLGFVVLGLKIERLRGILGRGRILPEREIGCRPIAIGCRGPGIELDRAAEVPDGGMIAFAFGVSTPSAVIRRGGGGQERCGLAEGLKRRVVVLQRRIGIAAVVVGGAVRRIESDGAVEILDGFFGMAEIHQRIAAIVVDNGIVGRELDRFVEIVDRFFRVLHVPFGDTAIAVDTGLNELRNVWRAQSFVVQGHRAIVLPTEHRGRAFASAQQHLVGRLRGTDRHRRHDGAEKNDLCAHSVLSGARAAHR